MTHDFGRRSMLRGAGALGLAAVAGFAGRPGVSSAATSAPRMTVDRHEPGTCAGQIFFTFSTADGGGGVEIADDSGTPLWSISGADAYFDFQRQTYQRRPVL